jgi:hypothetical protein
MAIAEAASKNPADLLRALLRLLKRSECGRWLQRRQRQEAAHAD